MFKERWQSVKENVTENKIRKHFRENKKYYFAAAGGAATMSIMVFVFRGSSENVIINNIYIAERSE